MSNPNPHTHPHPVQAMFDNCNDQTAFKQNLRDFLVQLKEFGDSSELYADERQVSHASKSSTSLPLLPPPFPFGRRSPCLPNSQPAPPPCV